MQKRIIPIANKFYKLAKKKNQKIKYLFKQYQIGFSSIRTNIKILNLTNKLIKNSFRVKKNKINNL